METLTELADEVKSFLTTYQASQSQFRATSQTQAPYAETRADLLLRVQTSLSEVDDATLSSSLEHLLSAPQHLPQLKALLHTLFFGTPTHSLTHPHTPTHTHTRPHTHPHTSTHTHTPKNHDLFFSPSPLTPHHTQDSRFTRSTRPRLDGG